jgi:hypothetical protein
MDQLNQLGPLNCWIAVPEVSKVNEHLIERINFIDMLIELHIKTQECVQHLSTFVESSHRWMVWFWERRFRLFGSLLGILECNAVVISIPTLLLGK